MTERLRCTSSRKLSVARMAIDCMTRKKYPTKTPASFDALLMIENTLYGIEFKKKLKLI